MHRAIFVLFLSCVIACAPPPPSSPTLDGMPGTVLTPDPLTPYPVSLTGPADGDPATALSVNGAFRAALNGIEASRLSAVSRRSPSYRSYDGVNVAFDALGYVPLTSGGSWVAAAVLVPTTFSAAAKLGAGLAASTRYNVYAVVSGGALDFLVSLAAPDAQLRYENGNTDHAFVGTLLSDAAGIVVPFAATGGRYDYAAPYASGLGGAPTDLLLGTISTSGAWTDLPLGIRVPPFAASVHLAADLSSAGGAIIYFRPKGVAAAGWSNGAASRMVVSATNVVTQEATSPCAGGGPLQYQIVGTASALPYVVGFSY